MICYLSIGIRDNFRNQLKVLVPLILSPKNLVIKKINGAPLIGQSLFGCFKVLDEINQHAVFSVVYLLIPLYYYYIGLHGNL